MASRGAIAGIQAAALKRVEAATATIVEQLGISVPPAAPHARQADLREAYELERQADLLEQIAAATGQGNVALQDRIGQLEAFITEHKLEVPEAPAAIEGEKPDADNPEGSGDPEDDADDAPDAPDGDPAAVADPAADAAGDAPVVADEYENMPFAELKELAKARGLKPGSSKAATIAALRAADAPGAA